MTIEELAEEYKASADLLWERIYALKKAMKEADEEERRCLDGRIRPLWVMYGETRQTARYLENYYGKKGRKGK